MGLKNEEDEQRDLAHSLRLTAVALVSAALTATLIIGIGGALLDRHSQARTTTTSDILIHTSG